MLFIVREKGIEPSHALGVEVRCAPPATPFPDVFNYFPIDEALSASLFLESHHSYCESLAKCWQTTTLVALVRVSVWQFFLQAQPFRREIEQCMRFELTLKPWQGLLLTINTNTA